MKIGKFFHNGLILANLVAGGLLVTSCSSSPKTLSASTNATDVINSTDEALKTARQEQIDVFAPKSYENAEKALDAAKSKRDHNHSNEEILVVLEKANAYIAAARAKANITKAALVGVADARTSAIAAGAFKNTDTEFKKVDQALMRYTGTAEEGDLKDIAKNVDAFNHDYRALEITGQLKTKLGKAQDTIKQAEKEGAKQNAPKTLLSAAKTYDKAAGVIKHDPRDPTIDQVAGEAQAEADKLIAVTRQAKASGGAKAEDVVVKTYDQQKFISQQGQVLENVAEQNESIKNQNANLKENLSEANSLKAKISKISKEFSPSEAEVYQQENKVIVRLKGIGFPKNKAEIPSTSFETLKKVQEAITAFDHPKVTIQGHTDATGSAAVNMPLSEQRAEAVRNYLTANLSLPADEITAQGLGSTKPLATNKTREGRAQNRRIDVIIE